MVTFTGGPGDDSFTSTSPKDILDGGGGNDSLTADYSNYQPPSYYYGITINQISPTEFQTSEGGTIRNFENLTFTGTSDTVSGDSASLKSGTPYIRLDGSQYTRFEGLSVDWSDLAATAVTLGVENLMTANGQTISWIITGFLSLILGGGDDVITGIGANRTTILDTGAGDDHIDITAHLFANTGSGSDTVILNFGDFRVNTGDDDDLVIVKYPLLDIPGDLDGGAGIDTLDLSALGEVMPYTFVFPNVDGYALPSSEGGAGLMFKNFELIQFADRIVDLRTNAAPTISTAGSLTVVAPDRLVTLLTGSDPEGEPVHWVIAGGADANRFNLELSFPYQLAFNVSPNANTPNDVGSDNIYNVDIAAIDPWGHATVKSLAITVLPEGSVPPAITVSVGNVTVNEADGYAHVLIERTGALDAFSIDYSVQNGSALLGSDYSYSAGSFTLVFAAGQMSYDVAIPIVNDILPESTESFTLTLSSPQNAAIGSSTATITILNDDVAISGGAGADTLNGTSGDDFMLGLGGDDRIYGRQGKDSINGGSGHDYISGQEDVDEIHGGTGNDSLYGGAGIDTIYGEDGDDRVYGGDSGDQLFGQAGADRLYGEAGDDVLTAGDGADLLYGREGDDILYGDAGLDKLYGGDGGDQLYGGADMDYLYGETGNDQIYGGTGNDHLYGAEGDDVLFGEGGNDFLFAGTGHDVLRGDGDNATPGQDIFYFDQALASSSDLITDFTRGSDHIGVYAAWFGFAAGALPANAFQVGSAPTGSSAVFLFNPATHSLAWYASGDGADGVLLATLANVTTLSAQDMIVL